MEGRKGSSGGRAEAKQGYSFSSICMFESLSWAMGQCVKDF